MKFLLSILGLIAAIVVVAYGQKFPRPNFPGYGPFNPRAKPPPRWRFRRDVGDNGQIRAHTILVKGHPVGSSLDLERKIFENDHGTIAAYAGANHNVGAKPEAHGGVRGVFTFGGEGRPMSQDERLFNTVMEQHRRGQ